MSNKKFKSSLPIFAVLLFEKFKLFLAVFKSYKIKNPHSPLLIIGSGRSGNTLLRSMLTQGGEIVFPPESYVWPRLYRKSLALSELNWEDYSKIVLGEFISYKEFYTWDYDLTHLFQEVLLLPKSEQNLGGIINLIYTDYAKKFSNQENIRWGDKTPINTIYIDKIIKIFPKAKIIHIVRDPRDVASSYVKAGLEKDYKSAIEIWDLSVSKANKLKNILPRDQFIEVKYEDLVRNPEIVLKNVCDFSNLNFSVEMLDFWKNFDNLGDTNKHEHHKNLSNPLSTDSIGKWKKSINSEVEKELLSIISPQNKKYLNE
jgi:protein-tyrosine sulfotransferase